MESAAKGGYVLANLAEVVERVLGFLPTKALLRAAWYGPRPGAWRVGGGRLRFAGGGAADAVCPCCCCSVCRLWRECARRTLRTRQRIAWVSALEPGPAENHALVRALARELEVRGRPEGRELSVFLWAPNALLPPPGKRDAFGAIGGFDSSSVAC